MPKSDKDTTTTKVMNKQINENLEHNANVGNWGYLRETQKKVDEARAKLTKKDIASGHPGFTAMEDYLKVIFPGVVFHHNVTIKSTSQHPVLKRTQPDFHAKISDNEILVIEVDDIRHYQDPAYIRRDELKDAAYAELTAQGPIAYKVVRIPYFIQLDCEAIEKLFGVKVSTPMFDSARPSMASGWKNTPAYLCPAGIERMRREFVNFPDQLAVNRASLTQEADAICSGIAYLP